MASKKHNFIVSAIVRKIRQEGFRVVYLDGKHEDIGTIKPGIPPKIIHHKPDVVGEKENGAFCIGEAKTENDVLSERTKNQINDFMTIVTLQPRNKLVIGIPANVKQLLEKLLLELELINHKQIETLFIPEKLLPYEEKI